MIEASKTAEPSSQQTKRRWKAWMIGLACVVAVTIIALLANAPKQKRVKVWVVRSTNEMGGRKLVFQGTNGTAREIQFSACVFSGAILHAKTQSGPTAIHGWTSTTVAAATNFYFALDAPPKDVPHYVMWESHDLPFVAGRWWRFRLACYYFFVAHRMPRLAGRFMPTAETHYIPSTEIKE